MKPLPSILILTALSSLIILFSFNTPESMLEFKGDDYAAAWKKIESLEKKGLPKSALEAVNDLYKRATKEKNNPQIVKTLIYRGKYTTQLEEEGLVEAITGLQAELESTPFPAQAVLQSVLANVYQQYLDNNLYKIRNRTETVDFENGDIRTWTTEQLRNESARLYLASVQNDKLRKISTDDFTAIITEGKNVEGLRPTLYDFLAHEAIDFFTNERQYLTEPAYAFQIDSDRAFAEIKSFVQTDFSQQDKESDKYRTLVLFQDLLKFHLEDRDPTALVDADLKRLQFVYNNASRGTRDSLYIKSLEQLEKKYDDAPIVTSVMHQRAQLYYNQGVAYRPNPANVNKFKKRKAYEICVEAVEKYPDSYGAKLCQALQANILQKKLEIRTEQVNLPNQYILGRIEYRNIDKVFLKVAPYSANDQQAFEQLNAREQVDYLNGLVPIHEWDLELPTDFTFNEISTEFPIDTLLIGRYVVLASDNRNFSTEGGAVSYLFNHVSEISYWHRKDEANQTEFVVTHRETGEPLEGVQALFYSTQYNQRSRSYDYKRVGNAVSNERGFIFPRVKSNYYEVRFSKGEDELYIGDRYSSYSYNNQPRKQTTTHFFLDRGIYRPGQTVYFKGIVIEKDEQQKPRILPNTEATVTFYDANYQEVKQLKLRTNEYGTFNGSFIAPTAGMLGQMSIQSSQGNNRTFFRVEEYKRPKFEVKFMPVTDALQLGEKVSLKGQTVTYAGSNVDGAKVQYRVVRETNFPYRPWWYYRGYNPYQREDMEVANGEVTTDENGNFTVVFTAIGDETIPVSEKPQFNYRVTADVTDITGETQSNNTVVKVGTVALQVDVKVADKVNRDTLRSFKIESKNLNGEFVAAKGKIFVHSLLSPQRTFVERYWEVPDTHMLSRSQFFKRFPTYAYEDDNRLEKWRKKEQIYSSSFNTGIERKVEFGMIKYKWQPGNYVLTLQTKDKYGQEIEVKKYFTLYDSKDKLIPINVPGWHVLEKSVYQPGEKAAIIMGTAEDQINVLYEIERNQEIVSSQWVDIKKLDEVDFDIIEEDRGNIHLHFSFVKNNRSYHDRETLTVPWTNKELEIEFATFRDKLSPGEDEEWMLKIKGNKKDKISAEMVATMYDASLDEFATNDWNLNIYPTSGYAARGWQPKSFTDVGSRLMAIKWQPQFARDTRTYERLNLFGWQMYDRPPVMARSKMRSMEMTTAPAAEMESAAMADEVMEESEVENKERADYDMSLQNASGGGEDKTEEKSLDNVKVRTNLNETVFFFPNLQTDNKGNLIIKFKMNEALTRWKFLGLAHTQDLKIGKTQREVITQKELMVQPNAPRFFREKDKITYTAKVSNLTKGALSGTARLELLDAISMQPLDSKLGNTNKEISFTAEAGQSARLAWDLSIPVGVTQAVVHRVVAQAGNFSDGEESVVPVLTNRMLVTETLPLPVRGNQTEEFLFAGLKNSATSSTLQHQQFTLEYTSNPAWYAVQALPYLMEYPYECIEQVFSRYYANSLATTVANQHPKIKQVFEKWKDSEALESNLAKNQDLKTALLEETPWVLAAQDEATQKKNIGLLFDLNKMAYEQDQAMTKIIQRQGYNGGFSWFAGGRENWYMTQYIVEGLGHLDKLGVKDLREDQKVMSMLRKALQFIDLELKKSYDDLVERKAKMAEDHLSHIAIHYLYARSFFPDYAVDKQAKKAYDYYAGQAEKYWLNKGIYQEGMLALALTRMDKKATATAIVKSLRERSLNKEELGMYWKYNTGYYWYQLPIETHALMIEVFDEVAQDKQAVDDLKVWLLKNKQTTHWKTTKATAAAVYALLMNGDNWLLNNQPVRIILGEDTASDPEVASYTAQIQDAQRTAEAGTGYFRTSWNSAEVSADMSDIKVENPNETIAWGAAYWQYFEELDKIKTFKETPLTLDKQLFIQKNSATGPKISPLKAETKLIPGDLLKVRIELRVDRDMEYVHLKDMRASGFEPVNVLSQYKYQDGLGYYESTGDVATNFFISYLRKGTYVFEYPLRVAHEGDFSNGITTIQCMYAPEFTSHSEGIRVEVGE